MKVHRITGFGALPKLRERVGNHRTNLLPNSLHERKEGLENNPTILDSIASITAEWMEEAGVIYLDEGGRQLNLQDFLKTGFLELVGFGGSIFYLQYEKKERILGLCCLKRHFKGAVVFLELKRVGVSSDERGKGYGKFLVREALKYAKSLGLRTFLQTIDESLFFAPSVDLYRSTEFFPKEVKVRNGQIESTEIGFLQSLASEGGLDPNGNLLMCNPDNLGIRNQANLERKLGLDQSLLSNKRRKPIPKGLTVKLS